MRYIHRTESILSRKREAVSIKYETLKDFLADIRSSNPDLIKELVGWEWDERLSTLKYTDTRNRASLFFEKDSVTITSQGVLGILIDKDFLYIKVEFGNISFVFNGRGSIELGNF